MSIPWGIPVIFSSCEDQYCYSTKSTKHCLGRIPFVLTFMRICKVAIVSEKRIFSVGFPSFCSHVG